MLFNSYEFIFLFLPVVFFGFFRIAGFSHRLAALWLAVASLCFYAWWNPKFSLLLMASITFNYAMGYAIGHVRQRGGGSLRLLLWLTVSANLFLLGIFKYTNFFISTVNGLTGASIAMADIVLPLGISFFTFTQIAFIVDVYRGIAREYNFIHYILFVTYFPHLIAGPVLHHKQMMPQFGAPQTYRIHADNIAFGLFIFALGLGKKVLIADNFAPYASAVFDAARDGAEPQLLMAWTGAIAYTFQLYFDFSGYSDMAIGISRLFGVHLPLNFNSPYKATSIIDFWRRWHMTLSQFLRDYLYIALGGNRHGEFRRYLNLLATMLLGGLWHGANWTFVAWGGLHGLYLVINHLWRSVLQRLGLGGRETISGKAAGWLLTITATIVAWVFFRADSFASAQHMIAGMAGMNGVTVPHLLMQWLHIPMTGQPDYFALPNGKRIGEPGQFVFLCALAILITFLPNTQQWAQKLQEAAKLESGPNWLRLDWGLGICVGGLFTVCLLLLGHKSEFLYFQF